VRALLADVGRIGPYFAVATGPAPAGGGWVPVTALAGPVDRPGDPLRTRSTAVRAALGTDDRVAASIAFQGLAAQLVAPLFAAVALHRVLPVPPVPATRIPVAADRRPEPATGILGAGGGLADALCWRPGGAGPWLWWAGPPGPVVAVPADALADLVTELLGPLVAAVRARVSISERVLWGDAASAVASARGLVAAARPHAADEAAAVAHLLLTAPSLASTSSLRGPGPPGAGWTFRRRSCCLYHRVPGGGVCGDCVLHDRPARPPGSAGGPLA
jgi:hypothetical protein